MLVTILTDASWCPDTGAAGYGYWIASGRGKRPGGNTMRRASNPTHAEMMAIANGLTLAVKAGLVERGDDVLVQTDSTDAIACLRGERMRYESFTLELAEVRSYVVAFALEHELRIEYRHVKGHSDRPKARYKANNHCDERAKKFMRRARRELRQNKGGSDGIIHAD
jgi:ribonuclease HI